MDWGTNKSQKLNLMINSSGCLGGDCSEGYLKTKLLESYYYLFTEERIWWIISTDIFTKGNGKIKLYLSKLKYMILNYSDKEVIINDKKSNIWNWLYKKESKEKFLIA